MHSAWLDFVSNYHYSHNKISLEVESLVLKIYRIYLNTKLILSQLVCLTSVMFFIRLILGHKS